MKRRRIIFSTGCYSTLIAVATMMREKESEQSECEDCLLLYSWPLPSEFLLQNEIFARSIWNFQRVVLLNDYYRGDRPPRILSGRIEKLDVEALLAGLGDNGFEEVLSTNIDHPISLLLTTSLYPHSRVMLYEEGLMSYSFPNNHVESPDLRSRIIARNLLLYNNLVYPLDSGVYDVPLRRVRKQDVLAALAKAHSKLDISSQYACPRGTALLLAQGFYSWGNMTWEDELDLLSEAVGNLQAAGFSVLVKEHPRNLRPFLSALQQKLGDAQLHRFEVESVLPIEMFIRETDISLVASMFSTALFSLSHLFGIPAFTFGIDKVLRHFGGRSHDNAYTCFVTQQYLPDLHHLKTEASSLRLSDPNSAVRELFQIHQSRLQPISRNPIFKFIAFSRYGVPETSKQFRALKSQLRQDSGTLMRSSYFSAEEREKLLARRTWSVARLVWTHGAWRRRIAAIAHDTGLLNDVGRLRKTWLYEFLRPVPIGFRLQLKALRYPMRLSLRVGSVLGRKMARRWKYLDSLRGAHR